MDVDPAVLRALRAQRGLRQADLARLAGLSAPYVSQLEAGERAPSPVVVKALAEALGVSVDALGTRSVTCPVCGTTIRVTNP